MSIRCLVWLLILPSLMLCSRPLRSESKGNDASPETALPFVMPSDFDQLKLAAWRVEQGVQDPNNPLLEPAMPWDEGGVFSHGTVLRDPVDGRWRAWQVSSPRSEPLGPGTWKHDRRLTCLESDDGVRWVRPKLSILPWEGYPKTNLLLDLWCSYASVNVDSRRDWPYEMFIFQHPSHPGASGRIKGLPLPPGADKHPYGLYRFHSRDGKDWQPVEGPIKLNTTDSCFIYRLEDGSYVAYHKTEIPAFPGGVTPYDIADGGLRLIGLRTSPDGTHWSDPTRLVMTPDWRDPADTQFMELCPVKIPGGFAATLTIYHNHTQNIDLQWAASRDGIHWWRPDRRPCLPNPPLGEYGGGMIWPMRLPVLEGSRLHVFYSGTESLHGDLFNTEKSGPRRLRARGEVLSRQSSSLPDNGALCRATWTADRLWALAPALGGHHFGEATTKAQPLEGKQLLVNVVTRPKGELRAELLDGGGTIMQGYSRDDCHPVKGDHHVTTIQWKSGTTAPPGTSRIRFYLKRAYLYGFDTRAK